MLLRGARFEQLGSLALVALAALIAACSQAPGATNGNQPPTISGTPPTTVVQGATYEFVPGASDPDGDALTFGIDAKPSWGVPQLGDVGTFANIGITVSDGQATVALPAFSIVVTPPAINHAPVISGTPMTSVAVGQPYAFVPTASDADGDTLTFTIANRPTWATFSATTGQLQGTPTAAGTFSNIVIGVSDGKASASLPAFAIVVLQPNRPPTISGSPPTTGSVGTAYTFTPAASDPDAG